MTFKLYMSELKLDISVWVIKENFVTPNEFLNSGLFVGTGELVKENSCSTVKWMAVISLDSWGFRGFFTNWQSYSSFNLNILVLLQRKLGLSELLVQNN